MAVLRSHSRVIVVTAAVTKVMGTGFLTADAPAAIASFGSGSRQISVRMIYPQGAAAYAAALRQDIAERKTSEITLLENPRITAPPAARRQLQGGQVDSRLLLTLAQLASQRRLSIVAFGDRAPGASSGVPLRSADLAVTGDTVGQAQQMSAFAHQCSPTSPARASGGAPGQRPGRGAGRVHGAEPARVFNR